MDIKTQDVKAIVKAIRSELKANPKHSHTSILTALASGLGFKSWEALEAQLEGKSSEVPAPKVDPYKDCALYYSFGKLKAGDNVNAFNARTLSPIIGTLDTVPGCAMLDGFTYAENFEDITVDYSGDTELYWDDQVTQHNSEGLKWYVDEDELRVPGNEIVFAPEKYATAKSLENLPERRELLYKFWTSVHLFMDPVEFLGLPEKKKLKIILDKLEPHVGLKLTKKEINKILGNQVYGDLLVDEWFGIMTNPNNDSDELFSGRMYETYGADLKAVQAMYEKDPSRVWTYLECDGVWVIASGFHYVNRMGYFLSEKGLPANVSSVDFLDEYHGTYGDEDEDEEFDDEDSEGEDDEDSDD